MPGTSIAATVPTKVTSGTKKQLPAAKIQAAFASVEHKWVAAKKAAALMRENMKGTAMCGVNVAETQGAVFATEVAAGYFGEDKLYVGGIDAPGVAGAAAGLWGLYEEATGGDGSHQLAVGNGLLATAIGRFARRMGRKLAEKSGVVPPPPAVQGDDVGALRRITQQNSAAPRMPMLMTPAADAPDPMPAARPERKGKLLNWAKRLRDREDGQRDE